MNGYVYIMINTAFPDLIKIGRTTKSSDERASELYTTGTPGKFIVVYDVFVDDCVDIERQMHQTLADKRYSENREFFETKTKDAIQCLQNISKGRTIDEQNSVINNELSSILFDGELVRYYLYCVFIGTPLYDYHAYNRGDNLNIYRFGLMLADNLDENDLSSEDIKLKIKPELKTNLINYYNCFEVFDFNNVDMSFIEFEELSPFYHHDNPLLSKSAKIQLEKIIQNSIAKQLSDDISSSRWKSEFDTQTIRYQSKSGWNEDGVKEVYLEIYHAVNEYCRNSHTLHVNKKKEEAIKIVRSVRGNF